MSFQTSFYLSHSMLNDQAVEEYGHYAYPIPIVFWDGCGNYRKRSILLFRTPYIHLYQEYTIRCINTCVTLTAHACQGLKVLQKVTNRHPLQLK